MFPELSDLVATARVVTLPLTTRFRGITDREAMLFEGPRGWTEFSPFLEYDDAEAATWLAGAIDFGWAEPATLVRTRIPVNATLPAVSVSEVAGVLARFSGCRTVKVKVAEQGQVLADDVARVAETRQILGPEGRIRVDANGGWNVDEAEHAVRALAAYDLEYLEQPCQTVPELAELRDRVKYMGLPVAADESLRKAADPLAVAQSGAVDLLVVKAQPLGGVTAALGIVTEAGLPAVVSSALETAVGISMGLHLAGALESLDYDCGLATGALFAHDIAEPFEVIGGAIEVRRVTPWSTNAATAERTEWWLDRLRRCYALLDQ